MATSPGLLARAATLVELRSRARAAPPCHGNSECQERVPAPPRGLWRSCRVTKQPPGDTAGDRGGSSGMSSGMFLSQMILPGLFSLSAPVPGPSTGPSRGCFPHGAADPGAGQPLPQRCVCDPSPSLDRAPALPRPHPSSCRAAGHGPYSLFLTSLNASISSRAQEMRLSGSPGGSWAQPGFAGCALGGLWGAQELDLSPDLVENTSWVSQPEVFPVRNPVPPVGGEGTRVLEGWTVPEAPSSSSISAHLSLRLGTEPQLPWQGQKGQSVTRGHCVTPGWLSPWEDPALLSTARWDEGNSSLLLPSLQS